MTSPAGSSGPPPAASAVAAASKQISVQDFSPAFLMASSQISRALFSHALLRDFLQGLYTDLSQASLQLEMSRQPATQKMYSEVLHIAVSMALPGLFELFLRRR